MNTSYIQKSSTVQKAADSKATSVLDNSSQSESLQRKADMANNAAQRAEVPRPNNTGMPDNLKSGIESLSGFSMDDVRVHYNSSKPATVQALAYTQGTDIHVAPGQEKHLPHEAWHVAQQMAGRVSPTTNINGMPVNDNATLEHEADVMGEKAVQCKKKESHSFNECVAPSKNTMQRIILKDYGKRVCSAKNVYEKNGKNCNINLGDPLLLKCFNDVLEKLGFNLKTKKIEISEFELNDAPEASWNTIYLENWTSSFGSEWLNCKGRKVCFDERFPIKVNDIVEDFADVRNHINYEPTKACVLQALYCAETGVLEKKDSPNLKAYHDFICQEYIKHNKSDINYQSDMGALFLYTSMGYKNVKNEIPLPEGQRSLTLKSFLTMIDNETVENKKYILLQDVAGVGHAIAVVNKEIFDIQGIYTKASASHYDIRYIYAK